VRVHPADLSSRGAEGEWALRPVGRCCLLAGLALAAACGNRRAAGADAGAEDLAARCERAVQAAPAATAHTAAWRFVPGRIVGDEERSPLGRIVGAAWHPRERRLYVLDAYNGGVSVFDSAGVRVASFGRIGGGPGEFEELGGSHGARPVYNQLAVLGDGNLAVMELGRLHVFTPDGRFVQRMRVTESDPGPFAVLHVAGFSARSVLFGQTGAMDLATDERGRRTALRLLRASVRGERLDTAAFGLIRNNLNRMPRFTGLPPSDPYLSYYRRTWDALPSGLLAVPSQSLPGVCFFDGDGMLTGAHRVDAPVIEVDHAERERVLNGFRAAAGRAPPMGAQSWEEQYPAWPRTVPPYGDVAVAPDSVAWLLRPLSGGSATVDLVHATRGYLGSLQPPGGRLPLAFGDGGCGYVIEERVAEHLDGGPSYYGLRQWCRERSAP
jgi:hypothetical protein